jgi:hypothetical protein
LNRILEHTIVKKATEFLKQLKPSLERDEGRKKKNRGDKSNCV